MIERVDRIQVAGPEAEPIAATYESLFGAERKGSDEVDCLSARRITMRLGTSEVEVLEPAGPGPVADFVALWRGGLFAAGFSTESMSELEASLAEAEVPLTHEREQLFIGPTPVGGLRAVLSPVADEPPAHAGLLKRLYEVTNPVADWKAAGEFYTRAFGINPSRWHPIASELYGYTGTLTLLEPPEWLDRIEITEITDYDKAMGRFHRRRGDSLYMCFAEVDDFAALAARLEARGARFAIREPADGEPNVLFVHPKSLHGMLMGVSRTGVAWEWSSPAGPRH